MQHLMGFLKRKIELGSLVISMSNQQPWACNIGEESCSSGAQRLWSWGPASRKTVFPQPQWRDDLGTIQAHDIYCAVYFYYYYISSTSDQQAWDPGGWGPLHTGLWITDTNNRWCGLSLRGSLSQLHNTENDVSDFLNPPEARTLAYTVDLQARGLTLSWTPGWKRPIPQCWPIAI